MTRKHFDNKGFPKLKEIISEICRYVEGLEVEYTDFPFSGNIIDTRNTEYGDGLIISNIDFIQGISKKPFKVKGVYVVGGQVKYLPSSYNTGEHDLDMIVKTNADKVTFSSQVESHISYNLANVLEKGKGCWSNRDKKEFALDLFDEDRILPLEPPYLQVYPIVRRVG